MLNILVRIRTPALLFILSLIFACSVASAQTATLQPDGQYFEKAKVVTVSDSRIETVPGTNIESKSQNVTAVIVSGTNKGKVIDFKNDYTQLNPGDTFYARHTIDTYSDIDFWSLSDMYRMDKLVILFIIFIIVLLLFGGIQGLRGLLSLVGSVLLIFYLLIPSIYSGYPVLLVSIVVSSFIIIIGSYITHGFNRTTSSAVIGMIITVCVTGILAYLAITYSRLTGFSSEEHTYLNLDTSGKIDMLGLLMSGVMIGLLGVLYDVAIGQAVSVEELYSSSDRSNRSSVYKSAIRIGREHIGALVNTLALAYVGVSMPLLLLIQSATTGLPFIINSEIFATEIIRILVGSIGLILAVPITTVISVYMLDGIKSKSGAGHTHHHH